MKQTALTHRFTAIHRHQRGASLLEGIAYLGIAAIVILGAISLLTGAFSSAQSNRLSEEVVSIRTGVKKLYMGSASNYGTVSINTTITNAKVFPATVNTTIAASPKNAFNGTIDVKGATDTFTITYPNVPQEVCIGALSGASGWESIKVDAVAAITTFPVTPSAANTACAGTTTSIVWESR